MSVAKLGTGMGKTESDYYFSIERDDLFFSIWCFPKLLSSLLIIEWQPDNKIQCGGSFQYEKLHERRINLLSFISNTIHLLWSGFKFTKQKINHVSSMAHLIWPQSAFSFTNPVYGQRYGQLNHSAFLCSLFQKHHDVCHCPWHKRKCNTRNISCERMISLCVRSQKIWQMAVSEFCSPDNQAVPSVLSGW